VVGGCQADRKELVKVKVQRVAQVTVLYKGTMTSEYFEDTRLERALPWVVPGDGEVPGDIDRLVSFGRFLADVTYQRCLAHIPLGWDVLTAALSIQENVVVAATIFEKAPQNP
jgi:hypothetical protein